MSVKSRERREKWAKVQEAREIEGVVKRGRIYDQYVRDILPKERGESLAVLNQTDRTYFTDLFENTPSPIVIDATDIWQSILHTVSFYTDEKPERWGFLSVLPPYEDVFIELHARAYEEFLVSERLLDISGLGVRITSADTVDGGYMLECRIYPVTPEDADSEMFELGMAFITLDEAGFIRSSNTLTEWRSREDWINQALYFAFYVLQFVNCRNVMLVDHESDSTDNLLYQRHFGVPLTKYKTLTIKPTAKRDESKPQQQFDVMPLHLRRGNFAHYTDDAPLFGKYTGTFWRPATAVGNEKNGVVVKGYKVQAPQL